MSVAQLALLLVQVGAAGWAVVLPGWAARADQRAIRLNGSQNSLRRKFHGQRYVWRVLAIVGGAMLAWVPPVLLDRLSIEWAMVGAGCYGLMAATWFLRHFNPSLNQWRDPPMAKWYVSASPDASWFDQFVQFQAKWAGILPSELLERGTYKLLVAACSIGSIPYLVALATMLLNN